MPSTKFRALTLILVFIFSLSSTADTFAKSKLSKIIDEANNKVVISMNAVPIFFDSPEGITARQILDRTGDTNSILITNNVANPIREIATQLKTHLIESYGVEIISTDLERFSVLEKKERAKTLAAKHKTNCDYILSITNDAWFTMSKIGSSDNYILVYSVELEFIDANSGDILIKSNQRFSTTKGQLYESRSENNAATLKKQNLELTEKAVKHFTKRVL